MAFDMRCFKHAVGATGAAVWLRQKVYCYAGSSDFNDTEERDSAASMQLDMPRRSRQVTFTCNKCGE